MSVKYLQEIVPRFYKSKEIVAYVVIFFLLLITFILGTGKLMIVYKDATEIWQQVNDMNHYINEWNDKLTIINNATYRPLDTHQIDDVQANILLLLQVNNLDLIGFKSIQLSGKKKNDGKIYEIDCLGSWESTIKLIENFHVRDALISITHLKLSPDSNKIKMHIQYKIYTR